MSRTFLISALFGLLWMPTWAQTDCPNPYDGNDDGAVTIIDLLGLLMFFGDTDSDEDGLWDSVDDCIDLTACNFSAVPTEPCFYIDVLGECGGGCLSDEDQDAICDDVDDCVGAYDECGVCNGLGSVYECGCFDIPAGDCDCNGNQTDALGVCGGSCEADDDADGICDDVDDCVGSYDACGVCNGPGDIYECGCTAIPLGDCDCNGNQLDALGFCGGECEADEDGDGLCDVVDDCVGEYDSCGVCNGPGQVFECGCSDIPEGDCDCKGGQLDALGECGGDCPADADADGICDDVDECVGAYDACGICNGPGDIYACGCSDIPDGDCDCDGNQLDAIDICGGSCLADVDGDGICDDVDDCVGALDACGVCNGPGDIFECGCEDIPTGDCDCNGNQLDALGACGGDCAADADADGTCDDVDDCVGAFDACGVCNGPGEIYECGCSDIPEGDCDCDGNQFDALGVCGGTCEADADADGICDVDDDCVGAFDACGICNGPGAIYACGCTDIPEGDCDCDGNQLDALNICGGDCVADADADGICDDVDDCVGAYDVCGICNGPGDNYECGCSNIPAGDCDCNGNQLDALGVCGGDCAEDADADGICDDVDDCVGTFDACGICNGPGDIYECGCADIPSGDCDCDGNQLDAVGDCGGTCTEDADEDGICDDVDDCIGEYDGCGVCNGVADEFGCCAPIEHQGAQYATVLIGEQCWFAENLRTETYANGDSIPSGLTNEEWESAVAGACAIFGQDSTCEAYAPSFDACDPELALQAYGRLYNWYAVDDERSLCPTGWHVPSDLDWIELELELGMDSTTVLFTGYDRGENVNAGSQLKSTEGWATSGTGNGTNETGFSGLPGGYKINTGQSLFAGQLGYWWTATPATPSTGAWVRGVATSFSGIDRADSQTLKEGFSVRCVKNPE